MTLSEFITRWRELVPEGYYKASTLANYESHIRKYLVPDLGDVQIDSVSVLDIQAYISRLQKTGISAKTIRNILMTMRVLWKSAIAWQLVKLSPFQGLMLPRVHAKERVSFTLKQISDIIALAPPPYNLFFWLAAETGMRAGELCGLRRMDVDTEKGLVHVRQSVWSGRVQMPKTRNSIRSCSISPQLAEALRLYLLQDDGLDSVRFLFTTGRGYPWNPSAVVGKLHGVLDALGLARAGLHSFRHTSASLADQFGLALKTRQARMGHADIRLTMDTYTHKNVDSTEEHKFVGWLGDAFSGNSRLN